MADSPQNTSWSNRLMAVLQFLALGKAGIALRSILEILEIVEQVRDRLGYHGMFEVLSYDATLEIKDATGDEATLTRRETIRFLQDNVVALHDHAWGNGELFADYHCRPGVPVDFYEDGSKHNVLISLRETKNRGDVMDLWIQRVVRGGLATPPWWLEHEPGCAGQPGRRQPGLHLQDRKPEGDQHDGRGRVQAVRGPRRKPAVSHRAVGYPADARGRG